MELFPAIDLIGGHSVRLAQGDYERVSDYGDPMDVARSFATAGASWLHVVDLDAARTGQAHNLKVVRAIAALGVAVQCGGGVRSPEAAERLFDAGVTRVVIGTAAVEDPGLVADVARRWPGQVAVGLDYRRTASGTEVAVRGWSQGSGTELLAALDRLARVGASAVVVTEIGRDGMLTGPDYEGMAEVLEATPIDVVASGGVSGPEDLAGLAGLEVSGRRLAGVIVGKALYEGRLEITEALSACVT
ncbi:MAG: 1-(5-phosphoribosyl)-5-[(5-phosphoribosylamino)methylideneamino]imidazole-4-carboxamide isomerase [Acidimicrobiales bacterium]